MNKQNNKEHVIDARATARLARLSLTDEQAEKMERELAAIVGFADKLNEPDCHNVPITAHVVSLENVMREDTVRESLERDALLDNAPTKADGYFTVPRVVDD